jgi:hypothetical protein
MTMPRLALHANAHHKVQQTERKGARMQCPIVACYGQSQLGRGLRLAISEMRRLKLA